MVWGATSPFSPPTLQDESGEGDHWVEFAQQACKALGSTPNTKGRKVYRIWNPPPPHSLLQQPGGGSTEHLQAMPLSQIPVVLGLETKLTLPHMRRLWDSLVLS